MKEVQSMRKKTRIFAAWMITLIIGIGSNVPVMADIVAFNIQKESGHQNNTLEITTGAAITQEIQAQPQAKPLRTQIKIHISQEDQKRIDKVYVLYDGEYLDLYDKYGGGYRREDNKEYAMSNITEIKVVLTNGKEIFYYQGDWDNSEEGNGTINYWLKLPSIQSNVTIEKLVEPVSAYPGDVVTYTITVRNIGDVSLNNIIVSDSMFEYTDGWPKIINLEMGLSETFIQEYIVPQNALGSIENTAVVSWIYKDISYVASDSEILEILTKDNDHEEEVAPSITISKSVIPITQYRDEVVVYTITVTNTGNVDLEGVIIDDPLFINGGCPKTVSLAVGETISFTQEYKIPEDAPEAIMNTVTATWQYNDLSGTVSAVVTLEVLTKEDKDPPPPDSGGGDDEDEELIPPDGGNSGGSDEVVEIIDEAIPLAYVELEEAEEAITELVITEEIVELVEEPIPTGVAILPETTVQTTLPKTGGIPAGRFYGLGSLLVAIGSIFRFKKRR